MSDKYESLKDKLFKLKALAERGVGGEADNARRLLRKLCADNDIDANGLPMVAEHSRAAYLGYYTVHATMYMDIPDPIIENENNQFK